MLMSNVSSLVRSARIGNDTVAAASRSSARAGDIGPLRKEIIFEPLREIPDDPPQRPPERPAELPVPTKR
jgi:hypothetical protein